MIKPIKVERQATATKTPLKGNLMPKSERINLDDSFDDLLIQLLKVNNDISPRENLAKNLTF